MLDWFTNIKELLEMTPARRNLLIGYLLLIGAIMLLYDDNKGLKEQIATETARRREIIDEERRLCNEQIVINRIEYQKQFTEFTIESNEKIDELNEEYATKSRVFLNKITSINEELKKIKNEISR